MHQSGHSRAQSMQTVQFSSNSPITPRLRGGSSGWVSGYWAVTDLRVIVRRVTASPLARPLPGIGGTYWITTLTMPVRAIWARASGMRTVHASFWSWSSRSRG